MSPATITDWLRTALFLPPESSSVARSIDHLHMVVIVTTMFGSAFVGLLALVYVLRHRHRGEDLSRGRPPETQKQTPPWGEWLIASGLFALFFAWWVVGFTQYVRVRVAPEETYDVYVTGKQWMWKFAYPDGHHSISRLYVPAGRPVKLILTSRDVIHSFFVPDFRLKQDAVPGRYTTLWFTAPSPGTHRVMCAEYCGTNHSTMRAELIVLDAAEFARWLAEGDAPDESLPPEMPPPVRMEPTVATELGPSHVQSLALVGAEVAARQGCLRCHTLDGSPHIGPTFAGMYRARVPLADGSTVVADEAFLTESMMDPLVKLHRGFQPVMPSYLGRLRPAETAAILTMLKSLAPGAVADPPMRGRVDVGPDGPRPSSGGGEEQP